MALGCTVPSRGPDAGGLDEARSRDAGETPGLRRAVQATVVRVAQRERIITAVDVATGRSRTLAATTGPVWQLSPPDPRGAVAILTPAAGERRYAVRLLADGRQRTLLEGAGDALWDDPVGPPVLSDDGRWLLAVAQSAPDTRFQPLFVGPLRCWDTGDGRERRLRDEPVLALGERPTWTSDGREVVYAAPGPVGRAAQPPLSPSMQPDPQIRRLDLATGREEVLVPGHHPVMSSDGRSMLLRLPGKGGWAWWDIASASMRPMPPLAGLRVPLALVASRHLVYTGEPSQGAATGWSSHNSPLVGPKALLAVKVADLVTGAFETLLAAIDPREVVAARSGALPATP